jgi:predicted nucleic acid-binding protein
MALARDARAAGAPVLLLIDDRAAVQAARAEGFQVTGTIGVLLRAAREDLIDLAAAFAALRATNFHCPPALLNALLVEHLRRGSVS